jgi:hypothetical protein
MKTIFRRVSSFKWALSSRKQDDQNGGAEIIFRSMEPNHGGQTNKEVVVAPTVLGEAPRSLRRISIISQEDDGKHGKISMDGGERSKSISTDCTSSPRSGDSEPRPTESLVPSAIFLTGNKDTKTITQVQPLVVVVPPSSNTSTKSNTEDHQQQPKDVVGVTTQPNTIKDHDQQQEICLLYAITTFIQNIINQSATKIQQQQQYEQDFSSAFTGRRIPKCTMEQYIIRIVKYINRSYREEDPLTETSTGFICLVGGLVILERLADSGVVINTLSIHRALIASVMVSNKLLEDHVMENDVFAAIGGVTLQQANDAEVAVCKTLSFAFPNFDDSVMNLIDELVHW